MVMTNPFVLGVLAAAGAGAAVGTGIYRGIGSMLGKDETLGGWLYDKTHGDPVAPAKKQQVVVEHTTNIDSQVLFRKVSPHFAKAATAPQLGSGRFDPGMMPLSPGMNLR